MNGGDVNGWYTNALAVTNITATPSGGYAFFKWTGSVLPPGQEIANPIALTMTQAWTLVANFTSIFAITTSSSPEYGGTTSGGGSYGSSSIVTVGATASNGYGFVNWTEGGAVVSSSASYSFVASGDRTLVANFAPIYTITTSSSPAVSGTTSGGGSYPGGSSVTVGATANAGYGFVNWTQDGSAVTNAASYSFVAAGNRSLVANFSPRLSIGISGPDTLGLAWRASANGYVLQQKGALDAGVWGGVTNPITVVGLQKQVLISPLAGPAFYRLFHP